MTVAQANHKKTEAFLGENLIFIISQPRSGSTLLQRILAGHPSVLASAETWLMLHPLYGLRANGLNAEYEASWARTGITEFLDHYAKGSDTYDEGIRSFGNTIYTAALEQAGKTLFIDKTPRYYYVAKDLYRIFPKAKFIFLLRNPMAVLASELDTYVNSNLPFLSEFADDLIKAPTSILEAIDQIGDDAIVIRYEEFAKAPEQSARKLCDQLGIEFFDGMLDYSKTPAPIGKMNDPVGIHRDTTTHQKSIDKWEALRDNPQHRHFALSYLDELGRQTMSDYGYSFDKIKAVLEKVEKGGLTAEILPWHVAITPRVQWSSKQRLRYKQFVAAKGHPSSIRWIIHAWTTSRFILTRLGRSFGV